MVYQDLQWYIKIEPWSHWPQFEIFFAKIFSLKQKTSNTSSCYWKNQVLSLEQPGVSTDYKLC